MNNTALRFLYILFIGVLLALFAGVGIDTFYKGPERPDFNKYNSMAPTAMQKIAGPSMEEAAQMQKQAEEMQKANEEYQAKLKFYNRDVSIIAMIAAVIIVAACLLLFSKLGLIADGLLLGGVLTLGYSAVRGFMTEVATYRFIAVSAGLAAVLAIGYFRFGRENKKAKK